MNTAPTSMDNMTLLQRQMEVSGSLRDKVTTPAQLDETRRVMSDLTSFFIQISRLATKLQLPLEIVFQCLMQIGMGDAVGFDKQCRQGNVPMHQAKVLDRNTSLNAQKAEPRLREEVSGEKLDTLVNNCQTLRTLCRMKVEDGNDLSMARRMVSLSSEYLDYIYMVSNNDAERMFRVYTADDEQQLNAALYGDGAGGGASSGGTPSGSEAGSPLANLKPLPTPLVKGIAAECSPLLTTTTAPFAKRSAALNNIKHWVETCDGAIFESEVGFPSLLAALQMGLKLHLAEKRSVLCRTACRIFSIICLRSKPDLLCASKAKDVVSIWLTQLLGQVHVTVAAIAEASDECVRDVIVSTQGAPFVITCILGVLSKATQPPLRRKCLAFLSFSCVASPPPVEPSVVKTMASVVSKFSVDSDDGCRRYARIIGLVLECLSPVVDTGSMWDDKVEKNAVADRQAVHESAFVVELFEVTVLQYPEPCRASAFVDDKLGIARAPSGMPEDSGMAFANGSLKGRSTSSLGSSAKSGTTTTRTEAEETKPATKVRPPKPWLQKKTPTSTTTTTGTTSSATSASPVSAFPQTPLTGTEANSNHSPNPSSGGGEGNPFNDDDAPITVAQLQQVSSFGGGSSVRSDSSSASRFPPIGQLEQPPRRVSTPGVPLSLRSFSQDQLNVSEPTKLSDSLRRRRSSSSMRSGGGGTELEA